MWPFSRKKTAKPTEKALSSVAEDRGWIQVFESYGGAFQQDVALDIGDLTQHPTVYANLNLISGDISKLPARLIRKDSSGMWTPVEHSEFSRLLDRPNSYQTGQQFRAAWVLSLLMYGNAYVFKDRWPDGRIGGLHVLDPDRVTPLIADTGDIFYRLRQDHLRQVHEDFPTCPAYEIISDRVNCMYHPLIGTPPLHAASLQATIGINAGQNTARLYQNGARPGGILSAPGHIKNETAERIRKSWKENYTGKNAGSLAVLGDGLTFNPMAVTAKDAEQVETLKLSDAAICKAFSVPLFKIGGDLPTYANIESVNAIYYSDCLQKYIEGMEACLTHGLDGLPKGYAVELDLDGLLRTDQKTKMETLAEGVKAGIMAPNEARRRLNLPPVDGGDSPYLQQQNYSLSALDERDRNNPWSQGPTPALPELDEDAPENKMMEVTK